MSGAATATHTGTTDLDPFIRSPPRTPDTKPQLRGGPRWKLDDPDGAGGQAQLVGVTPAAFTARMDRVRSQLTAGAVQAQQSTRIAPCHRRVRFVVPPWRRVDYTVHLDEPDPQLSAVGVVQPGRRDLQGLADTHDELPVAARAALTGAAGVAAGIAVAGDLQWPGLLEALLTVGLGGAGVAAQVSWCRSRIRRRQDSRRLIPTDEMFLPACNVLAALMRAQMLLAAYPVQMKREAKLYGLQPVPRPTRHNQVPAAMHQALWDLLTGTGAEPPDQVQHAAPVADAVRRDIWSAWNEFDSFHPTRAPKRRSWPPGPRQPPKRRSWPPGPRQPPTYEISPGDLAQDRAVRERAVQDVRDINDNTNL